jgi:hypothetical protein
MPTVNHFGAIAARLKPKAHAIVAESIVDIRDSAKAHSRVDKGEMRDGWTAEQTSDTAARCTTMSHIPRRMNTEPSR